MINVCTVSDKNYLVKGLTMYESLLAHSDGVRLHYLCLDDETYQTIKLYECWSLIPTHIDELLKYDVHLRNLKDGDYKYYCWSLASYFTDYLMNLDIGDITYIDSDILFHQNISLLLTEIGNNEVGIFRHRQFPLGINRPEGLFNVGVVHFKNTKIGRYILNWWADAVLLKKHRHLATCGDQKYLDEFPNLCPNDYIFVYGNVGHGAPWQWQLYDLSEYNVDGTISWNGVKQLLIFTHFSQFSYDLTKYIPSTQHHIYTPLTAYQTTPNLKLIYDDYFNKIKQTTTKYAK